MQSLLVFGTIPDLGHIYHPKEERIQSLIEKTFIEYVAFDPNDAQLEDLHDNHELFGIERVWQLLENAEWPQIERKTSANAASTRQNSKSNAAAAVTAATIARDDATVDECETESEDDSSPVALANATATRLFLDDSTFFDRYLEASEPPDGGGDNGGSGGIRAPNAEDQGESGVCWRSIELMNLFRLHLQVSHAA